MRERSVGGAAEKACMEWGAMAIWSMKEAYMERATRQQEALKERERSVPGMAGKACMECAAQTTWNVWDA